MTLRIEDYGLIGDMHTAALVGIDGSIDWLCLPRFDSSACFAHLLGTEENGRWRIAPAGNVVAATRRYRPSTLVLETDFETADGVVRIIDCMALRESHPRIVRVVEGVRGTVPMSVRLNPRFDYGKTAPWVIAKDQVVSAGAGPDAVELRADVPITLRERRLEAEFSVRAGERACFVLTWYLSWEDAPPPIDAVDAVAQLGVATADHSVRDQRRPLGREPGVQGDRVSGALKPATVETGLVVQVPLFVNQGDKIKVRVEDAAEKAAPTVRELSAKAAELVAVAADRAAPIAKQAGEATAGASSKLAVRSREWAAEIREQVASNGGGAATATATEPRTATDIARDVAEDNPPL